MIVLPPIEEGKKLIRQAYEEKRLSAQSSAVESCTYRTKDGVPCAIGALIPEEQAGLFYQNTVLNNHNLSRLVEDGYVGFQNPEDAEVYGAIQMAHDSIINIRRDYPGNPALCLEAVCDFEELIA